MLVVRGTKKLRDRLKGPLAGEAQASTTVLGDWFATVLFWRPRVVLLVNERTMLPVFMELAPAATLLHRVPCAIETILQAHGVDEQFIAAELEAMRDVLVAPTNNRSVVGVMNEFAFHNEFAFKDGLTDLAALSLRAAHLPLGPLRTRTGFPDLELAAVTGRTERLADIVPFPGRERSDAEPLGGSAAPKAWVFQLKITLLDTKPPVWRRVLVDGSSTLDHVHDVIQAAFGWWGYHLHEFQVGKVRYGRPDIDDEWDPPRDERRARLDKVAREGTSIRYTYDFGDGWVHRIEVEKAMPAAVDRPVPACVDGRRACPPEDCGGPWGYDEFIAILADPAHPERDERLEWIGGPFDPDAFEASDFEDNLCNMKLTTFDDA